MYLQEFFDYKNQLMGDLLSNQKIVDLLNDYEDRKPVDPQDLAYTQCHPYEYIPETVEHGQTFINTTVEADSTVPTI